MKEKREGVKIPVSTKRGTIGEEKGEN